MLPRAWPPSYRVIRYDARGFGQSPAPDREVLPARRPDLGARLLRPRPGRVRGLQPGRRLRARAGRWSSPVRVSALVLLCPGVPGYPVGLTSPTSTRASWRPTWDTRARRRATWTALAGAHGQRVWAAGDGGLGPGGHRSSCARRRGPTWPATGRQPDAAGLGPARVEICVPSAAAGRRRGLPAAAPGQPGGCGPDPGLRADRGPGDGPPAAACASPASCCARSPIRWLGPAGNTRVRNGCRCRRADRAGSRARRAGRPGPAVSRHPLRGIPGHRGPVRGAGARRAAGTGSGTRSATARPHRSRTAGSPCSPSRTSRARSG